MNEHIFVLNEQKVNRLVLILRLSPSVLFKICSLCFVGCVQRYSTGQSDSFFIWAMIINNRFNIWNCSYHTYDFILSQFCRPSDIKLLKTHEIWFKSISSLNLFSLFVRSRRVYIWQRTKIKRTFAPFIQNEKGSKKIKCEHNIVKQE